MGSQEGGARKWGFISRHNQGQDNQGRHIEAKKLELRIWKKQAFIIGNDWVDVELRAV